MKKALSIILSLCMIFSLCVFSATAYADDANADLKGKTIALCVLHLNNDFNRGVKTGVENMAKDMGMKVIMTNGQGDNNKHVSDIQNLLSMSSQLSGVIICGGEEPSFAPYMKELQDQGIPVVTVDMVSEYSNCNVTSDNFNGGEQLSLYVNNKLGSKGNILLLHGTGWLSLDIRARMLESVISDHPDLSICQTMIITSNDAVNAVYKDVKAYLQGNPDVGAIYCTWGLPSVGAAMALRELGLEDEIFIVCTDADQVVLEEMMKEDSPLTAVVGQYPEKMGSTAVQQLATAIRGGETPREVYAPIILIEKEDPDAWFTPIQPMLPAEAFDALYPAN